MTDRRSPLHWPAGRPRTLANRRATPAFGTGFAQRYGDFTINEAIIKLQEELDRLGATSIVLSSNLDLRLDGLPRSGQANPSDPGVALYFKLNGRDTVLACDRWMKVQDNIFAIAKHIDALRGMDRWGVGTIEQAFAGYQALPAPEQWWQVLGVGEIASADEIRSAYRRLASKAHPDTGGSDAAMARLNAARDDGLRKLGQ